MNTDNAVIEGNSALDDLSTKVRPSARQLAFQQLEFYAFIHFSVNTFTDREWGDGTEPETCFDPVRLDVRQWAESIKSAGMRGAILTCKHHDGFCLWPSKLTSHTVANSPYLGGKGDIVGEFASACREYGLKFGVYLSPWDRNCKVYGEGKPYDDYFVSQLEELLGNYGEVFCVWFDGACGEGPGGKVQRYDWNRYYEVIRRMQPDACINVCGPDIRWCGNEAGHTRKSEWSVVSKRAQNTEKIEEASQTEDNEEFRERKIRAQDEDLGSRKAIMGEKELVWYPAEVNTSIRPGWFYHSQEDDKVKSLEELVRVYENSVGGNATFLLNIPPNRDGMFHENDVKRLRELGDYIRNTYGYNMLAEAVSAQDNEGEKVFCDCLKQDDYEESLALSAGESIMFKWDTSRKISRIVLKEDITKSQRVEEFAVYDGDDREIYRGTVIGYKKIIPIASVNTNKIRIRLLVSRKEAYLSFVGVY